MRQVSTGSIGRALLASLIAGLAGVGCAERRARPVVVERVPPREVVVERAPADVIVERGPREVVVERPRRDVIIERPRRY